MSGFERKNLSNGDVNPKYIDLCDEDPPISGQKFVCMSFVSPEKILKQRELFIFERFIQGWDFTKSMMKMSDFVNFLAYKYNLKVDDALNDFKEFVKEEHENLKNCDLDDDFKNFMDKNEESLNEEFNTKHAFQTSVRGLKLRGVFNTQEEAELRCKKIRDFDPNHDIFVGPIGMWIPWDPDAYKTGRIEFMEEELNQLHNEKAINESKAKEEFEKRVKESKKQAIQDNIAKATASGNVLTQTMNDDGELIGVKDTINFDEREEADSTSVNLRNELLRDRVVADKEGE
jgi:hypothetical protein